MLPSLCSWEVAEVAEVAVLSSPLSEVATEVGSCLQVFQHWSRLCLRQVPLHLSRLEHCRWTSPQCLDLKVLRQ